MSCDGGVTVAEFVRLMKDNAPWSYKGRFVSIEEAQQFLDRCAERGLLTRTQDAHGQTFYSSTHVLADGFGPRG
jgi:hypothetical protein